MNTQQTAEALPKPANAIDYRTFNKGGLIYQVYTVADNDTPFNERHDPDRYAGVEPAERAKYEAQDEARYNDWQGEKWQYLGVCVDIRIKSDTNWTIPHKVGAASLWGIESDSGAEYFVQVEAELIGEAEEDVRRTFNALKYAMSQIG